jgi:8-oxo-dGTP pyrophosphatase MutT (NUDIX family)
MQSFIMNDAISSFIADVTQSLGNQPLDFYEKTVFIQEQNKNHRNYLSAGVCMPFYYHSHEFYIQLIKRSVRVSQPGDLSFPGGMLSPFKDHILKYLISSGIIPLMKNNRHLVINKRDHNNTRLMTLFLASAIREAWEEVRMNPFNLIYLGTLPTYTLKMFHRVIFPSVCFLKSESCYRMNEEVDSIIDIPLSAFFIELNYYRLHIELPHISDHKEEFPCLLFKDKNGEVHVLWGATFFLIMNFLHIVWNFQHPSIPPERLIKKTLLPEYHHP